jgi:hypothetical protein
MKKWISELLTIPGFFSFEYGLYLYDLRVSLVIGGIILMTLGLMVAKNGSN